MFKTIWAIWTAAFRQGFYEGMAEAEIERRDDLADYANEWPEGHPERMAAMAEAIGCNTRAIEYANLAR